MRFIRTWSGRKDLPSLETVSPRPKKDAVGKDIQRQMGLCIRFFFFFAYANMHVLGQYKRPTKVALYNADEL